eukprot:353163-Chlamydomonas_euryale.AAC.2
MLTLQGPHAAAPDAANGHEVRIAPTFHSPPHIPGSWPLLQSTSRTHLVLVVFVRRVDVLPERGAQLLRHLQRKRRNLLVELFDDRLERRQQLLGVHLQRVWGVEGHVWVWGVLSRRLWKRIRAGQGRAR